MTKKKIDNKKHLIKWAIISIVLLGIAFLTTAYVNGKDVVEDEVTLQWVSHTEYWRDDSASTIIRLADYRGNPYQVDECRVTILKPDKTVFVDNQPMAESNISGNWYRTDALEGAPLGTYEQEVVCTKDSREIKSSQSFHLNPALEQVNTLSQMTDALNMDLSDVNVTINGKIAETGEEISTTINSLDTSLNDLLNNINTGLTSEIQSGVTTLGTQLSDVELNINGTVESTGQSIESSISSSSTSLTNLINSVNTNISEQMVSDLNVVQTQLDDVNLSLSATVLETGETISTNLTNTETNLNTLINSVNSDLSTQLGQETDDLNASLQNINLSLDATIAETGDTINTNVSDINTSITNLMQTLNTSLSTQITQKFDELKSQLNDVNLSLSATVTETGETITTNLVNTETNLTNLLNTINVDLTSEITDQFNNTNALIAQKFLESDTLLTNELDSLEVSVNGQVVATGNLIQSQLSDVNQSLYDVINNLIVGDLNVQLNDVISTLSTEIQLVKDDTTWLTTHAMNDTDMQEIESRFTSVDNSLLNLEQFCSQEDTNSSALCTEIYNIKTAIEIMNQEQETTLNQINQTTTNTWNLLSGDITTKLDSLLTDIGIIKAQTTDINSTVHQIVENQESEIQVRIIS